MVRHPRTSRAEAAPERATPEHIPRLRLVLAVFTGSLLILVAGLGYQQLVRRADHTAREHQQNQRRIVEAAPRGVIYDREGRVLAGNRVRTAAVVWLGELRGQFQAEQNESGVRGQVAAARARLAVVQRHLDRVNTATGRQDKVDALRLERAFARERLAPFMLADNLSADETARLSPLLSEHDPVRLHHSTQRIYPRGALAAHVIGRVRHTAIGSLPTGRRGLAGDSGIEKQHDSKLSGVPGELLVRVDAWGFPTDHPLTRSEPVPGEDVVLSLDLDLQLAAEEAIAAVPGRPRGGAVAIAVATGEVLALTSQPAFDLNTVSPAMTPATKRHLDAAGSWLNRATQGLYPPGSTFKIFTMLAGLRGGTLHSSTEWTCAGYHEIGGRRFHCHNIAGHGNLTLPEALARSCNVFAYRTGLAAGPIALAEEARRFHLGDPTNIDLPGETSRMLVPDPAGTRTEEWTEVDTANLSIGQGELRCSPLQMACAIASLARRETLTVPTLLRAPGLRPTGHRPVEPLGLPEAEYAVLIAGLRSVVERGIGRNAQVPGISMAGKTGTAQVTRPEGTFNIAWFVAFAPVEKPEIAIAVALEGDRPNEEFAGAQHAAPIVREIAGAYFDKRAKP